MSFLDSFTETQNSNNRCTFIPCKAKYKVRVGANESHSFNVNFDLQDIVDIHIFYTLGSELILDKSYSDLTLTKIDDSTTHIICNLNIDDTLKFNTFCLYSNAQIKIKNSSGNVWYSDPIKIYITKTFEYIYNNDKNNWYKSIKKYADYLYEIVYDSLDYQFAEKYFWETNQKLSTNAGWGACSAVRVGNFYGRNLDWTYSNESEFLIRVPSANGDKIMKDKYNKEKFYSSCGVAFKTNLTDEIVDKNEFNDSFNILPFIVVDGMNEKGLSCNTNIVPISDLPHPTNMTNADKTNLPRIQTTMVIRYLLDHCATAREAVDAMQNDMRIYTNKSFTKMGFENHWLINDKTETYVVEIIDDKVVYTRWPNGTREYAYRSAQNEFGEDIEIQEDFISIPDMYNFYRYGLKYNEDGSLYGPKDVLYGHIPSIENNLGNHAEGIERSNVTLSKYINFNLNSKENMFNLMTGKVLDIDYQDPKSKGTECSGLEYTNTYRMKLHDNSNFWYTEFVGAHDANGNELTVDSSINDYENAPIIDQILNDYFVNRKRDESDPIKQSWQTIHTSIYDFTTGVITIVIQENQDTRYEFKIDNWVAN